MPVNPALEGFSEADLLAEVNARKAALFARRREYLADEDYASDRAATVIWVVTWSPWADEDEEEISSWADRSWARGDAMRRFRAGTELAGKTPGYWDLDSLSWARETEAGGQLECRPRHRQVMEGTGWSVESREILGTKENTAEPPGGRWRGECVSCGLPVEWRTSQGYVHPGKRPVPDLHPAWPALTEEEIRASIEAG